eukprot:1349604-Prymnesium_polylepis.2
MVCGMGRGALERSGAVGGTPQMSNSLSQSRGFSNAHYSLWLLGRVRHCGSRLHRGRALPNVSEARGDGAQSWLPAGCGRVRAPSHYASYNPYD